MAGPGTAAPAPEPSARWWVESVAGGYQLTLRLAAPLPMRDAIPLLAVDGRAVGVAQESADRRTVTAVTADPRVLRAREVEVVHSPRELVSAAAARPAGARADWSARRGPVLPVDPGAAGRFTVQVAEYDLGDEAIVLPGVGYRSELRGRVYSAPGAHGARPTVVFLHGQHEICYGEATRQGWPCPPGMRPVPSYRGYDAPARALASHGYHVVSISANAINGRGGSDGGTLARAQLVLAHLDLWKRWSSTGAGPFGDRFRGRVDLTEVGLMGHSRGGEGMVRAALLNATRRAPYGVRAVLPLAPTDFARLSLPGVAMSVLLPYCDGDVFDLQGQHLYDDTRHVAPDRAPRSTVLVMGANHNFFNTEWTPGQSEALAVDDWFGDPDGEPCGVRRPQRLTASEQQAVGRAYIAGFFRLVLGGERALLPLLDGSDSRAASAGRAVVRVVAQTPDRLELTRFDRPPPAGSVAGGATAQVCAGTTVPSPPDAAAVPPPWCSELDQPWRMPHWVPVWYAPTTPTTAVTRLRWTGVDGVVRIAVPAGRRDVRRFDALTLRISPDVDTGAPLDLTVRVLDGRGRFTDVATSAVSDALVPLPGSELEGQPKTLLRTVRIPLASLAGLDRADIRAVQLRTDRVAAGSVFLSDLAFSRSSMGRSGPIRWPRLSVSDAARIPEGDDGGAVRFTVTMSRPSPVPVSVHVETSGFFIDDNVITRVSRRLTLPAGRTRAVVSVPIKPNDRDSHDQRFSLLLALPRNAVVTDEFGTAEVFDDDPSPTLTAGDAVAAEDGQSVRFPLRLSAPSDKRAAAAGELVDGTAVLGADFLSESDDGVEPLERDANGTVRPGQTTGWMEVRLLDDAVPESDETFTIPFQVVDALPAGPSVLTGTILDNDH